MDKVPKARSKRRLDNSNHQEYIIKTGLMKSIQKNFENPELKQILLDEINERVKHASQGIHRVALALHLFVKEKRGNLGNFTFLSDKSTTFIYRLMIGYETQRPITEFQDFLERNRDLLPNVPIRHPGDRNTLVRASEQFLINYRTMLETTFANNQLKMLKLWKRLNNVQESEKSIQRYINGLVVNKITVLPRNVSEMIDSHRQFLELVEIEDKIYPETFPAKNYELVLKYNVFLNDYIVQNGSSALCIVPMSRIKAHYIHIDSSVFYGILKSINVLNCNETVFTEFRHHHWEYFFPSILSLLTINQRGPNGYANFTGTIQTDGIAINIHYRRPKLIMNEEFIKKDTDRIIGVDSGRTNPFYGVEELPDGTYRIFKFTRNEYYQKTGITKANRKKNFWNQRIQRQLNDLSQFSHRGSDLLQFYGYLHYTMEHYDDLWDEYLKRKWGRQRFDLYSRKQEFFNKFMNSLKDNSGRRVVLSYGNGKFNSTGPGEQSVPTTRLFKECSKHFNVNLIDEHRTSRINSYNDSILLGVKKNGCRHAIRGLQWCPTNGKFLNRDCNSAIHMINLYNMYPQRPEILSRGNGCLPPKMSITFDSNHWRSIVHDSR